MNKLAFAPPAKHDIRSADSTLLSQPQNSLSVRMSYYTKNLTLSLIFLMKIVCDYYL